MGSEQKFIKTTDSIKIIVAEECGVDLSSMDMIRGRRKEVEARQIAMYMMRRFLNLTYREILYCFPPIENHTTVVYSLQLIDALIGCDKRVASLTFAIAGRISELLEIDKNKKRLSHYTIFDGKIAHGMYQTEEKAKASVGIGERIIPVYV